MFFTAVGPELTFITAKYSPHATTANRRSYSYLDTYIPSGIIKNIMRKRRWLDGVA